MFSSSDLVESHSSPSDHDDTEISQIEESGYVSKLKIRVTNSRLSQDSADPEMTKKMPTINSEFINEFPLAAKEIELKEDVAAKLICNCNESGVWELYLSEIIGSKVVFLFGRTFTKTETIELDSLIPSDQQKTHYDRVASILNEGTSSKYWEFLFNGMMSRTIKIVNYQDKTPRFVKIHMELNPDSLIERSRYVFNITLRDETATYAVASKAGQLTHDLRGYMRAGINTVSSTTLGYTREEFIKLITHLSPEELARFYDLQQDKDEQVRALFTEGLKLCSDTREDFLPETIIQKSVKRVSDDSDDDEEVTLDESLQYFIHKPMVIPSESECEVSYVGDPNIKLASKKINILEHFILNLISNAIKAGAKKIDVKSTYEEKMLTVEVTDNGRGMSANLLSTFFSRTMPKRTLSAECHRDIEENRGEWTLIANERWESIGGRSEVMSRNDGVCGTTFKLSIAAQNKSFFMSSEGFLSNQQKAVLADLAATESTSGIILLVDDSIFNIKMLFKKLTNTLSKTERDRSDKLQLIESAYWQQNGFVIEHRGDWCIICVANGGIAYDIVKMLPVKVIITDYDMPIMNGGDLIVSVRKLERKESRSRMKIALNTGRTTEELASNQPLDVDMTILKGEQWDMLCLFAEAQGRLDASEGKICVPGATRSK